MARPRCGCDGCQLSSRACTHCVAFLSFSAEAQRRPYYADYSPARKYIHSLCTSHYLDLFITFIIGVNVITMSMEHYNQPKVRAIQQNVGCETQQHGGLQPTPLPWHRSLLFETLSTLQVQCHTSIFQQASSAIQSLAAAKSLIPLLLYENKTEQQQQMNKANGVWTEILLGLTLALKNNPEF